MSIPVLLCDKLLNRENYRVPSKIVSEIIFFRLHRPLSFAQKLSYEGQKVYKNKNSNLHYNISLVGGR